MLDPGRYFAEAIYFLEYTLAQILWAVDRALLSVAVIAESVNAWLTNNIGYFVELFVNALSAPLGGLFILALTALGAWYALNNVVATERWVDPGKLFTYGFIAFFFFSSPVLVIDKMEALRLALLAGVDEALIDGASGDIFTTPMNGTDTGLPAAMPDVNSDGAIGSFDLVSAFMRVANLNELDNSEFPVDFEAAYFPFGDPSGIDLGDEADQELARALAVDGIERLLFSLVAVPTAIAEHFLRLALTGVAVFLYLGVPLAMLLAFFVYTQAFLGAYLRQFVNLLIETFMSVIIVAIMIRLLVVAAGQGIGLYIAASLIAFVVLLWRVKSALKLAAAAFDLFGGGQLSGGSGGMGLAQLGRDAAQGALATAGAAATGGLSLAVGGTVLAGAAALRADQQAGGAYLGADPLKTEGRVQQLKAMAGYALGRSETVRGVIEKGHEVRTLTRNFRDGEVEEHDPDMLDYLRAGSSISGFGSSPWLAMRLSPSLRAAYDEIGGRRYGQGVRDAVFDGDGERVDLPVLLPGGQGVRGNSEPGNGRSGNGRSGNDRSENGRSSRPDSAPPAGDGAAWREEAATSRQRAYLRRLGVAVPGELTRGRASDLINQARQAPPAQTSPAGRNRGGGNLAGASPTDRALADRFAGLEQALATLTTALTHPGGADRIIDEPSAARRREPVHGPLPAREREDAPPETGDPAARTFGPETADSSVQGRPGRKGHPDAGGGQNASSGRAVPDPSADATPPNRSEQGLDQGGRADGPEANPAPSTGAIHLEPHNDARQQTVHKVLGHLAEPHSPAGQAAFKTLVVYAGADNAARVQEAVARHTADSVQAAAAATAELVAGYQAGGMADAAVLAAFQSGEAAAAIREVLETPLSDAQLAAVADMTLLPQRRLTRPELVSAIGREVAAGAADEQAVTRAIGSPVGFGGQTGNVRGVMAGARAMNLAPAELARLAELIQDGLRDEAQQELIDRGYRAETVRDFVGDMAALPGAMVVPQTTADADRPPTGESGKETPPPANEM